MTDHIQIGDIAPRIRYAGDGSTVQFTYPFPIFTNADIEVYVDSVKKTLTSDYSVTGAGVSAGGTVTFLSAPAEDAAVTLVRRLAIKRTTDFQASGEFRAKVINDELDYQTAALQQIEDDLGRAVRLALDDAAAALVLPAKATRASKVLAFDENGHITVSTDDLSELEGASASATAAAASASAAASDAANAEIARIAAEAAQAVAEGSVVGVKVSADDTSPGDLETKLLVGDGLSVSTQNPGAAETRTVALDAASQAEAEAGADNVKAMTALRTAQAIAALAETDGVDQTARDMAASALAYAMATNDAASITGGIGAFVLADDFEGDTLAVKTNATYDAAGDYYHNLGLTTTTMNAGLYAGDTAQFSFSGANVQTSTINAGIRSAGAYLTGDFTLYATFNGGTAGDQCMLGVFRDDDVGAHTTTSSLDFATQSFEIRGDGKVRNQAGSDLATFGALSAGQVVTFSRSGSTLTITADNGAHSHVIGSVDTGAWYFAMGCGGSLCKWDNVHFTLSAAPPAMTLVPSVAGLATANPTDVLGYFILDPIDDLMFGVDVTGSVSIDGGTTDATGSWTKVGQIAVSGQELWRLEADVSAQSGASLVYEIQSTNGKQVRLHACVGLVPIY